MGLSDLQVYNETAYATATEVLAQQIELFNAASGNTLIMRSSANQGDFTETAFFKKVAGGLVRRRNPYGSGAIAKKKLSHGTMVSVKVAAGTPELELDPAQFRWIQMNPEVAGATFGQQLAVDMLADMLNTSIIALVAAIGQHADATYDATAGKPTFKTFNKAARKFGDRANDLVAWLMHSATMFDITDDALLNAEQLFMYGTVNIRRDAAGRPWIISDSPSLVLDAVTDNYFTAGLVAGAVSIEDNGDYDATIVDVTGTENIKRAMQAEWSYNLEMKGYRWDKAGGAAPNDAALGTAANWDRYATDVKDTAGVLIKSL